MKLDKLILDNFLSFEHLEYDFENQPVHVQGINLTNDIQKSNGSGKSTIQTGIEVCMTASNSRGVRDNKLVRRGKTKLRAQLFSSCDVRKESIHIDREIKKKGSALLSVKTKAYGGEWKDVSFSNVKDGNKFIEKWFAIAKEDLFSYYIINEERFKSFFKATNKEKVDLINRFSDASIIEGLDELDTDELDERLRKAEAKANEENGSILTIKSQIEREENRDFDEELEDEIEEIKEEIGDVQDQIYEQKSKKLSIDGEVSQAKETITEEENNISDLRTEEDVIKADISKLDTDIQNINKALTEANDEVKTFTKTDWEKERFSFKSEIKETKKEIEEKKLSKEKREKKEKKLQKLIAQLNSKLHGAITCPNCQHEWIIGGDLPTIKEKLKEADKLKPVIENMIEATEKEISKLKQAIEEIDKEVSKINKKEAKENTEFAELSASVNRIVTKVQRIEKDKLTLQSELSDCNDEIKESELNIKTQNATIANADEKRSVFDDKISGLLEQIEQYKQEITDKKAGDNKELIKTLKKELSEAEKRKNKADKKVMGVSDEIYQLKQWAVNFKQFRMFVANKSLNIIEYHMNRYLSDMGSDMTVKMEGYKLLANGTVKEEITPIIIYDAEECGFTEFSKGERGQLLFASILANRHMINETHPYGGLDFLSIDEIFEGVDSLAIKHLLDAAKTLDIAVMFITHVTDEEIGSNTLFVIKENGVSRVEKRKEQDEN